MNDSRGDGRTAPAGLRELEARANRVLEQLDQSLAEQGFSTRTLAALSDLEPLIAQTIALAEDLRQKGSAAPEDRAILRRLLARLLMSFDEARERAQRLRSEGQAVRAVREATATASEPAARVLVEV